VRLRSLALTDWRNAASTQLNTDARVVVLHGENAQGKTNLLEAVWLLATLRSFRDNRPGRLIREGQPEARIDGVVDGDSGQRRLSWRRTEATRQLLIDGAPAARLSEWFALLRAVLFCPEHAGIVRGEPTDRRSFLDRAAFTAQPSHLELINDYGRVLKQKGALLRSRGPELALLDTWDASLARIGARVALRRQAVLDELAGPFAEAHAAIAGGRSSGLSLQVRGIGEDARDEAQMVERLEAALRRARPEELRRGTVLCGPHRDDLLIELEGRDARRFASQGQARSLVLALKLAELEAAHRRGQSPLFLLDDLTGELDARRMARLVERLGALPGQVWITTTDPAWLGPLPTGNTAVVRLQNGVAEREA
jgi:DNA replication and repair protein RecF